MYITVENDVTYLNYLYQLSGRNDKTIVRDFFDAERIFMR